MSDERIGRIEFAPSRQHTTHFDDCGCLNATLRAKLAAAEKILTDLVQAYEIAPPTIQAYGDILFKAREALKGMK